MKETYYDILGITSQASEAEIKHAYRQRAKVVHPDKTGSAPLFISITDAYDVLSDPKRREAYDRSLSEGFVVQAPLGPSAREDPPGRPGFGPSTADPPGGPPHTPPPDPAVPRGFQPTRRPARKRRGRQYVVVGFVVVGFLVGGVGIVGSLGVNHQRSIGDACLVGTWRSDDVTVPFRNLLDGQEVASLVHGGSGVLVTVTSGGTVKYDFSDSMPLTGSTDGYRIESRTAGTFTARWHATDGKVKETDQDLSRISMVATINGRPADIGYQEYLELFQKYFQVIRSLPQKREPTFAYRCSSTTLEVDEQQYTRQ